MDASRRPATLLFPLIAALGTLGTIVVAARWTGPIDTSVLIESLSVWGSQGAFVVLWLGMALGFGSWIAPALDPATHAARRPLESWVVIAGVGIAFALSADALLGWLGLLLIGGGLGAWGLTVAGLVLLVLRLRSGSLPPLSAAFRPLAQPAVLGAAVPAGVLLLAATSAPGWLWRSEFGGYDALSYHLTLPKEWIERGGIATLEHNVYSAFPSYVEAAFLHLFVLAGSMERGALGAQCLAALLTLVSALAVAALARRVLNDVGALLAAVLYLATPWTIVVGSLAYNDGAIALFLAVGTLVALRSGGALWQRGATLGLLLGAACGAKLTASGFVVLPLVAVAVSLRRGKAIPTLLIAAGAATLTLSPWLLRNGLATGNPFFPFLTDAFGLGHWTPEQAAIFADGHRAVGSIGERVGRLWSQWLAFGVGTPPVPNEPWSPQWSLLPIAGVAGLVALALARRTRRAFVWPATLLVVLGVQVLFWLAATHLQSRFLLPTAVPLTIGAAWLLTRLTPFLGRAAQPYAASAIAVVASLLPLALFAREGVVPLMQEGARVERAAPALFIGASSICTGDGAAQAIRTARDEATRNAMQQQAPLAFFLNHLLPAKDRVLLVGDAKPFWYRRTAETLTYSTVWDRGPLSAIAAAHPDEPQRWAADLAAKGYTWIVLDWTMLANWGSKGWLDPTLTEARLKAFAESMPLVKQFPGFVELRATRLPNG